MEEKKMCELHPGEMDKVSGGAEASILPKYKAGDKVTSKAHPEYGDGVIVEAIPSGTAGGTYYISFPGKHFVLLGEWEIRLA